MMRCMYVITIFIIITFLVVIQVRNTNKNQTIATHDIDDTIINGNNENVDERIVQLTKKQM